MEVDVRTITHDEFADYVRMIEAAFSYQPRDEDVAVERSVAEIDRSLVAVAGSSMVGAAAAYSLVLTVPGAKLPMAGVTGVGVLPTHRRQGILTELMRRQLEDVRDRGEVFAGLYASEGSIYGRFGYGLATFGGSFEIERDRTAFIRPHRPTGQVALVDRDEAMKLMPPVYERMRGRPGMIDRNPAWWEYRFADLEHWREGATPYFFGVRRSSEGVDGYAVYRVKHDWQDGASRSVVQLRELLAETPEAYADAWRFCFDIDLIHRIEGWERPVDEPLLFMLAEPRRLRLRMGDALWLRLVDLPKALAGRRYAREGRLVLQVRDPFCSWNEGRYELEGGPDGAECRPTDADPDVSLGAADVGAVYLGGVRFATLSQAGRVFEDRPGAVARADVMFAWDPPPWCPHMF
jgi:predicted acetyltransferase